MYVTPDLKTKVALGQDHMSKAYKIEDFNNYVISSSESKDCQDPKQGALISSPHSNSFVDLNGDCMPDLFLMKQTVDSKGIVDNFYEVYVQKISKNQQKYCLL